MCYQLRGMATAAIVLGILLSGCSDGPSSDSAQSGAAAPSVSVNRELLHRLMGSGHYRYLEADEPVDLADEKPVQLALVGEVAGYEAGPDMFPDDETDQKVLMKISPTDVFDGSVGDDGLVRVMVTVSIDTELSDLEAALPVGSPTVLYLNAAVDLPSDVKEPLWVPVSPQGFITEDQEGTIFPLDSELDSDQPLDEQVPASADVP